MVELDIENEADMNVDSYLIQAALIYAQAASLYAFARRRAASAPAQITWKNIRTSFQIAGVYEVNYPDVHAFISRLEARRKNPEENDPQISRWMEFKQWLNTNAATFTK